MRMNVVSRHLRHRCITILLWLFAGTVFAEPDFHQEEWVQKVSVEDLKGAYLKCNAEALAGHLDRSSVMFCSVVYETLKQKAFEGDFGRLLAWSRTQPKTP